MAFDLKSYLQSHQALVDAQLRWFLERDSPPAVLREVVSYSLLAPGKRLRPILVFMAAQAAGGSPDAALPAACAVEMIHTYSLIHDDLPAMDDDDLRRGLPTCHKKYGEALAILAGDGLLTLAFQILAEQLPPKIAAACCKELARGSGWSGMVGGQVEDLAWERGSADRPFLKDPLFPRSETPHSLEALEHIHHHKTGALFRACLKLGVLSIQGEREHGPERDLLDRLDIYARCFGLVFQITDDLIDVEGSAAETGKRTQKDAERGKLTYPGLLGIDESRRHAQQLAEQAFGSLAPFGKSAEPLAALLEYVLRRDR
ncbi:MAG: polyprenyl synthetase family protein [Planctomycetota bacterium]